MGTIYPRRRRWWIKFKLRDGRWKPKATPYLVEKPSHKTKALALLAQMEAGIRESALPDDPSRITVEKYGERWLGQRRRLHIDDWTNDESKLRHHIYPQIGMLRLAEVRAIAEIEGLVERSPLGLIRSRRHLSRGGYDADHGRWQATKTAA